MCGALCRTRIAMAAVAAVPVEATAGLVGIAGADLYPAAAFGQPIGLDHPHREGFLDCRDQLCADPIDCRTEPCTKAQNATLYGGWGLRAPAETRGEGAAEGLAREEGEGGGG